LTEDSHGTPPMRVRIGENDQKAKLIEKVQPKYPEEALKNRIAGTVALHVILEKDGTVKQLEVLSGHPLLSQAAVDAVRQWKYRPTLLNGEPVEVDTRVDVIFALSVAPKTNP
jgi:protein TonB